MYHDIYHREVTPMTTAKVFKTGRSQAVRLTKEFRFDVDEVVIKRLGDAIIMYPRHRKQALLEMAYGAATPDFMVDRNQPKQAERRRGL